MPSSVLSRAILVAACAAGVAVSLLIYRSNDRLDTAEHAYFAGRPLPQVLSLLRRAGSAFNPDTRRDSGIAVVLAREGRDAEAERRIRATTRREPENVLLWYLRAQIEVIGHDPRAARSSYARAQRLDPYLPAGALPPPP